MQKRILVGSVITFIGLVLSYFAINLTINGITEYNIYRYVQKQDWLKNKPQQVSVRVITKHNPQLANEDVDTLVAMLKELRFSGKNPEMLQGEGDIVKLKYNDSEIEYYFGNFDRVWIRKDEKLLNGYYIDENLGVKLFGFCDRVTGNYYKWLDYKPQEVSVTTMQGTNIQLTEEKQIHTLIKMIKELRIISGVRETLTGPVYKIKLKYEYMEAEYTFPSIDQVWVCVKGNPIEKYQINKEMGKEFFVWFYKI
jgi:hypothetical protein